MYLSSSYITSHYTAENNIIYILCKKNPIEMMVWAYKIYNTGIPLLCFSLANILFIFYSHPRHSTGTRTIPVGYPYDGNFLLAHFCILQNKNYTISHSDDTIWDSRYNTSLNNIFNIN